MASYDILKNNVKNVIKQNGNGEITGDLLQQILLTMIGTLGSDFQFAGVAVPETNPPTSDSRVFYLAGESGTYSNFTGIVLDKELAVIIQDGDAWQKVTLLDSVITKADLPTKLSQLSDDATHRLVTDAQITNWNNKQPSGNYVKQSDLNAYLLKSGGNITENLTIKNNQVYHSGNSNNASTDWNCKELTVGGKINTILKLDGSQKNGYLTIEEIPNPTSSNNLHIHTDKGRNLILQGLPLPTGGQGNVGIGISSNRHPAAKFEVGGDCILTTQQAIQNGISVALRMSCGKLDEAGGAKNAVGVAFNCEDASWYKNVIAHVRTKGYDIGDFVFCLNEKYSKDNAGLQDEKMRITSNGNVGIGTSAPISKLDVNGDIRTRGKFIGKMESNQLIDVPLSNRTQEQLNAIFAQGQPVIPQGDTIKYYGEKLKMDSGVHECAVHLLHNQDYAGQIGGNTWAGGLDIWDNKAFIGFDKSRFVIIDLMNYSYIKGGILERSIYVQSDAVNHVNNCCFWHGHYRTPNSIAPLLFCSQAGGFVYEGGYLKEDNNNCVIYDIGADYVPKIVETMHYEGNEFPKDKLEQRGDWVFDPIEEYIYFHSSITKETSGIIVPNGRVTQKILKFKLPPLTSGSVGLHTFHDSDIVDRYEWEQPKAFQGSQVKGGILYMLSTTVPGYGADKEYEILQVHNLHTHSKMSEVDLTRYGKELEGISLYNNKIYVNMHKRDYNNADVNLYEINNL